MKYRYTVTLDSEIVDKAKEIMEAEGKKISPVINILLTKWLKEEQEKKK